MDQINSQLDRYNNNTNNILIYNVLDTVDSEVQRSLRNICPGYSLKVMSVLQVT